MPKYRITGPDGAKYDVTAPDGANEQDVLAYVQQNVAKPSKPSAGSEAALGPATHEAPKMVPQTGIGALYKSLTTGQVPMELANQGQFSDLLAHGLTSGFSDEMLAGLSAPVEVLTGRTKTLGEGYDAALKRARESVANYRERNPVSATGAEVLGGLLTGGTLAKGGATLMNVAKPTLLNMAGRGAAEGALYGGAYGFGSGEGGLENRAISAGKGAALGAATGGAFGGLGYGLASRAANKTIPTTEQIRKVAGDTIEAAKASGVTVPNADLGTTVQDLATTLKSEGYHPALHPRLSAPLEELSAMQKAGVDPSLADLHVARRLAQTAGKTSNPDEGRLSGVVVDKIDDLIGKSMEGQKMQEGLKLWHRFRKADMIETAVENAKLQASSSGSGGNVDNAIRQQIKSIIRYRSRGFTGEELDAMRKVVAGGPVQNLLRLVGKLSPQGNGLMAALGIGATMANPMYGMASLAGLVAKPVANRMTGANMNALSNLVRSGGTLPTPQLTGPQRAILESLLIGGSQQGTSLMNR